MKTFIALYLAFTILKTNDINLDEAIKIIDQNPVTDRTEIQIYKSNDYCAIPSVEIQIYASNPKCNGNTVFVLKHEGKYSLLNQKYSFDGVLVYEVSEKPTGLYEYYVFNKGCHEIELLSGSFVVIR